MPFAGTWSLGYHGPAGSAVSTGSAADRTRARVNNTIGRVTVPLGDDCGGLQTHQTEGYPGEVRENVQRLQDYGRTAMPLPGAAGIALYPNGNRGNGIVVKVDDARYRPTGLNPGEQALYTHQGTFIKLLLGRLMSFACAIWGVVVDQTITISAGASILLTTSDGEGNSSSILIAPTGITLTSAAIKLGGADASKQVAILGSTDTHGDSINGATATKVFAE